MKIVAVHLSAASALPMVKAAKAEGLPLTVETCHHYLRFLSPNKILGKQKKSLSQVDYYKADNELCFRLG